MKEVVKIIGGGLAGSEAAYYLAKKGYNVKLYDIKLRFTANSFARIRSKATMFTPTPAGF